MKYRFAAVQTALTPSIVGNQHVCPTCQGLLLVRHTVSSADEAKVTLTQRLICKECKTGYLMTKERTEKVTEFRPVRVLKKQEVQPLKDN